jgi:acyl carrier protein
MSSDDIKTTVREFILKQFLPDEDPGALTDTTPLIRGAILDSIATVKLVTFLEERYGVAFAPHEMGVDYLDTIEDIVRTVSGKKPG